MSPMASPGMPSDLEVTQDLKDTEAGRVEGLAALTPSMKILGSDSVEEDESDASSQPGSTVAVKYLLESFRLSLAKIALASQSECL